MRIAFDLDDTLIPTTKDFSCGSKKLSFPLNLIFSEELRCGAPELLKFLSNKHDIWIYTTSLRKELYLKIWFFLWGVKITSVVNQQDHRDAVKGNSICSRFSKAPSLFGIKFLIDDLPGVGIECKQQNCGSLILSTDEPNCAERVQSSINEYINTH